MLAPKDFCIYIVQNNSGLYFRAKGYHGYGDSWVEDIKQARIYTQLKYARATVTWFANNYKDAPTPDIIRFNITEGQFLVETDRLEKIKREKAEAEYKRKCREQKASLEKAKREYEVALMKLKMIEAGEEESTVETEYQRRVRIIKESLIDK